MKSNKNETVKINITSTRTIIRTYITYTHTHTYKHRTLRPNTYTIPKTNHHRICLDPKKHMRACMDRARPVCTVRTEVAHSTSKVCTKSYA